jgi:hypothetical protein
MQISEFVIQKSLQISHHKFPSNRLVINIRHIAIQNTTLKLKEMT